MALEFASGIVSHLRLISKTHGQISTYGGGIQTSPTTMFRVGGHLAEMDGAMSLADGDEVAIVGSNSVRGILGLALFEMGSRRMSLAPTDRRKLVAGTILMNVGIIINFVTILAGLSAVEVGTFLLVVGGFLIWLHNREISQVQEAVLTIYARTPGSENSISTITSKSFSGFGGELYSAVLRSPAIASTSSSPARLLTSVAGFFAGMSLLYVVALFVETIAGLIYAGFRAIPSLSLEWLVVGIGAAMLWMASAWLFATAAFDAASIPISHERSEPALGSPPVVE